MKRFLSKPWAQAVLIAVLALIAYANNTANDWAYDDFSYITENRFVVEPGHVGDIFTTSYLYGADEFTTGLYRPVTVFSYAANRALTGMSPAAFHLVNDILHAACSVMAFLLLGSLGFGSLAFPAALLFALHPIHSEAVTNVVGRAELLACLFSFAALYCLYSGALKRRLALPLALAFFLAALMSKETPAVLPVFIVLAALGDLLRGEKERFGRDLAASAAFFAVFAVYLLFRHMAIANSGPPQEIMMHENLLTGLPLFERLPPALLVFVKYLRLLIVPLGLSADYSYNQIPLLGSLFAPGVLLGLVIAAGLFLAWLYAMRRDGRLNRALLLFGLPLLFVSNIPFTTGTIMGERLLYLPSFGFIVLLLLAAERVHLTSAGKRKAATALLAAVSLFYFSVTVARNFDWKDNTTLFAATARRSPDSVKTCYNYALSLRRQGQDFASAGRMDEAGRLYAEAVNWYRRAVAIWPEHRNAWFNLGNTLADLGRYPGAAEAFEKADALVPEDSQTLHNLALSYQHMKAPEKAVAIFERFLEKNPGDIGLRMNIADAWREAGELDRALGCYEAIAADHPDNAGVIVNIGNIHLLREEAAEAEAAYRKALAAAPTDPNPNNALLAFLLRAERFDEAKAEYDRMQSRKIPVMRRLAELLARRN